MRKNWKSLVGVFCCCGALSASPITSFAGVDNEGMPEAEVDSVKIETLNIEELVPKATVQEEAVPETADTKKPAVIDRTRAGVEAEEAARKAREEAKKAEEEAEEQAAAVATARARKQVQAKAAQEEARALEEQKKNGVRQRVVDYALSFVGGPYRYGGTDPRTGVDCSGFTRFVLSNAAGVQIARTSVQQAAQGVAITADQMQPGDLLFYSQGGRINHVAMYIGSGKVVHASTYNVGITVSNWNYRTPVKIINVIG